MPPKTVPLTDLKCRSVKPFENRNLKLFDGGGLFLEVRPNGSKLWRLKYRIWGKEKLLALGAYPLVTLAMARELRAEAKQQISSGKDPIRHKMDIRHQKMSASDNTLKSVFEEWFDSHKHTWVDSYSTKIRLRLEKDILPRIGATPISELRPSDILAVLKDTQARGALETAHRVRHHLSQIFKYAKANGLVETNIAADLVGAIPPAQSKSFASIKNPKDLGRLLKAIYCYEGSRVTCAALKLAPMLFCRPGELRGMQWSELHLEIAEWRIPALRQKLTKAKKYSASTQDFIVPLSKQAIDIIEDLRQYTGNGKYVFASTAHKDRSISENTVNQALRTMGFSKDEITGHGFRHTASTMLNGSRLWHKDAIERQLSHKEPGVGGIYNNAEHLDERKKIMQYWADYLDSLRVGN